MNVPGMNGQRDLEGLNALVTGATSGIGWAAAEELGRHGAEIVVHGRDADRGSVVAGAITAAGGKACFVAADLADPAQVPESKTVKNRMHLDVVSDTFAAEAERLLGLGARRLYDVERGEIRWTTFADIEGNEFDLIAG